MKPGDGTRETGNVDLDGGALTNGGDISAETTQHPRAGLDVLAGQQPRDLAGPARERGEHHGSVRDAFVARRPDDALHVHASACRRHCAAQLSHAVTAWAFPSRVDVMYTTAPLNRSPRAATKPCSWVPASGWPPAKRGPSPSASARATIARFTDPTSVISAPAPTWGLRLPSRSRLAAGGAASTSSSTARATSAARDGASSIAPCRAAATRSPGSGDHPSTVVIPARFAWRASEPPIAPRPMMPSLVGRTG